MDIEFHYYMTHLFALRAGFAPGDALPIPKRKSTEKSVLNLSSYQATLPAVRVIAEIVL